MLNKFTYQLELNALSQCTTKSSLKAKIVAYNYNSFGLTSSAKITIVLPFYNRPDKQDLVESKLLYAELLQLAIQKYVELYGTSDLPMYAQYLHQSKIKITLKE